MVCGESTEPLMSRSCTRILYTNSFSMVLVSPSKFAYFRTSAMNLSAETSSFSYPAFFRGHQRVGTPEYLSMMRLRKIWAEGSFSVLKREHCISKIRIIGAAAQQKIFASATAHYKHLLKMASRNNVHSLASATHRRFPPGN